MKTPKASIKKHKLMLARFNLFKEFDELQELREKVRRLEKGATRSRKSQHELHPVPKTLS